MREALFLKQNADKWKALEIAVKDTASTDDLAEGFIELTDDLSYAKTFYPQSNTVKYLNGLAAAFHQKIYSNKKEKKARIWWFWQFELPYLFKQYQKEFLYAFLFFMAFVLMGALSAKYDENFIRLILGDDYVNMTANNIEKGDPFGVYKQNGELGMFMSIAFNNIKVAFIAYVMGITACLGTLWLVMNNGLMMGSFQYYFISKGLGTKFILVVFIHGTLELWSIVIATAAGFILGKGILFPGTYSRGISILYAGKNGLKIVFGLVPLFLTAAFFESFVTRHTEMPLWLNLCILICSILFIIWYFVVYPIRLHKKINSIKNRENISSSQNLNQWISKKLN